VQARGISSFFKPVSSMFLDEDLSHPSIVQAQSARTTNLRNQIELAQRCASDLARKEIYDEAAEVETQATRLIHELRMISEEFELVREAQRRVQVYKRRRDWRALEEYSKLEQNISERLVDYNGKVEQRNQQRKDAAKAASDAKKAIAASKHNSVAQDQRQTSQGEIEEEGDKEHEPSTYHKLAPLSDECNRERQGHRYDLQDASKAVHGKGKANSSHITAAQFREKMQRSYVIDGVIYSDMDQQSFTYDAGTLFCTCCSTTESFYHAAQHVKTRRDLLMPNVNTQQLFRCYRKLPA